MNSLERLKAAISHQEPDHVPYDLGGTTVTSISGKAFENAMAFRGLPTYFDESKTVDVISNIIIPPDQILEKLHVSTKRVGIERTLELSNRLEVTGTLSQFTDQYNCLWAFDSKSDHYFNQKTFPLDHFTTIREAADNLELPDFKHLREHIFALFDLQLDTLGTYGWIADRCCAGLTEMAFRFRGYSQFYLDLAMDGAGARMLLEKIAEHKIAYWEVVGDYILDRGLEEHIPVIAEADDLGVQNGLLVSKKMMDEIIFPPMSHYLKSIKAKMPWVKIFFHCCGSIKQLLPDFIDMGIDILNPIQYSAKDMDLAELKKEFGKELTFWGGGLDTQTLLASGTPAEVEAEVKRTIDILAPGGGFVFVPVHNILENVAPENFWAMWDAWNTHGKY
jgi:uroporphyrinogen decarboxylase